MNRKALLLICEGETDRLALYEPLKNYFKENFSNIQVEITKGDIAYKKDINEENCINRVEKILLNFMQRFYLDRDDIVGVVQLVDTDGAFCDVDILKEDPSVGYYEFSENEIRVNGVKHVSHRFLKKQSIYNVLLNEDYLLGDIKYLKFYVSRNIEHAFYNEINTSDKEKVRLAKNFNDKYSNDSKGFKDFLESLMFEVPNDYHESWTYILKDNNSMKRCSNLKFILEELINKKYY